MQNFIKKYIVVIVFFLLSVSFLALNSPNLDIRNKTATIFEPDTDLPADAKEVTGYAWNDLIGWIDFNNASYNSKGRTYISNNELYGFAVSDIVGLISLNCANDTEGCTNSDYKVEQEPDGSGTLTGFAWGENIGWIDFSPEGGGVSLSTSDSEENFFTGHAWSESIGWISFSGVADDSSEYSLSTYWPHSCSDGIQNQDETGIDCGGDTCDQCTGPACVSTYPTYTTDANTADNCNMNPLDITCKLIADEAELETYCPIENCLYEYDSDQQLWTCENRFLPVPPIELSITPEVSTIYTGDTVQLTVSIVGTTTDDITWTITPIETVVGDFYGMITDEGLYTAPSHAVNITIIGRSVADPDVTDTVEISVRLRPSSGGGGGGSYSPTNYRTCTEYTGELGTAVQGTGDIVASTDNSINSNITGFASCISWCRQQNVFNGLICNYNGQQAGPTIYDANPGEGYPNTKGCWLTEGTTLRGASGLTGSPRAAICQEKDNITGGDANNGSTSTTTATSSDITISISPATSTILTGSQLQFTANITGVDNKKVIWTITPIETIVGDFYGTISDTGIYTAPMHAVNVTIIARSQANSQVSTSSKITVRLNPNQINLSNYRSCYQYMGSLGTTVQGNGNIISSTNNVSNPSITNFDSCLSWCEKQNIENGLICNYNGEQAGPTTSYGTPGEGYPFMKGCWLTDGLTLQGAQGLTGSPMAAWCIENIIAEKSASSTPITITIKPSGISKIFTEQKIQFTAEITGTENKKVTWSISPADNIISDFYGTITNDGLYTAPKQAVNVKIIARPQADISQSDIATVDVRINTPVIDNIARAAHGSSDNKSATATEDKKNNEDEKIEIENLTKSIIPLTNSGKNFITRNVDVLGTTTERIVANAQKIVESPAGSVVTKSITTAGVVGGGIAASSVLTTSGTVVADLLFLPFRLWGLLLSVLGLKRKNRPWGTVYDSVTKQPIDPAYVTLKKVGSKNETTSITDLDGRYGFLVSPGKYILSANKTNYIFPSKKAQGKTEDVMYDNLYFGEKISIDAVGTLISKNIPMDPLKFDWNEFVKGEKKLMKFYSKRDKFVSILTDWIFRIGLIVSIASVFLVTTSYNIAIFVLYLTFIIMRKFGLKQKALGHLSEENGSPLSFAIVRVYDAELNIEITSKVADRIGRYYCLVNKGKYYVMIEKKNDDESYTLIYTSPVFEAQNGIINKNFIIKD